MDLDLTDRRLLLEIDRAPVAPLAEIAHTLGVGERTVSRRFSRLREEGLVRVVGRTRPGVGGRDSFLARVRTDAATADALAERLARLPGTRWVRLSRDGSDIICALTAGEGETSALHLLPRNPQVHRVETCEILWEWTGQDTPPAAADRVLDDLDRVIVDALGRDGRMETRRIALQAGVDPSTISRRRARLIEDGILFFEAEIHPGALSRAGDVLLWLVVAPGQVLRVAEALRAMPECRFVAACTGRYRIVANLLAPAPGDLVDLLDTGLADLGVTLMDVVRLGSVVPGGAPGRKMRRP